MADARLHENGYCCPSCELRREAVNQEIGDGSAVDVPCNQCGGTGRIGYEDIEICMKNVRWARVHYWPERERRWAQWSASANA